MNNFARLKTIKVSKMQNNDKNNVKKTTIKI